ncbi:MAG: polysaccharide deacetylase family protein [Hyphomicrobiaceae bacterium]
MSRRSTQLLKAALSTLYYSGAGRLAAPITAAQGVVFMLHRVTPEPVAEFEPNRILKITPEFLDEVIRHLVEEGYDILTLDELPQRLARPDNARPFACFTLDDGYRDNLIHALPVFRRHGIPFAIYVPTDYPDGRGDLWWIMLERVVRVSTSMMVDIAGSRLTYDTSTASAKDRAFHDIYWRLRGGPEEAAREIVARLAENAGLDTGALCRELIMSWDEIRQVARDPLATIAAHTVTHRALAKLDPATLEREIADSVARLEAELGRPCRHFSYPYGCEESAGPREFEEARRAGLATAMTTRKGLVGLSHANALWSLPRFSLNGDFQDMRYVRVMLSGLPFALWDAASRVRRPTQAAAFG